MYVCMPTTSTWNMGKWHALLRDCLVSLENLQIYHNGRCAFLVHWHKTIISNSYVGSVAHPWNGATTCGWRDLSFMFGPARATYLSIYLIIYLRMYVKEWFIVDVHFFPWDCRYDGFKNTMTPTLLQKCHFNKINDIAFPNNYSDLFATASTNDIRLWNLKEMKELLRIEVHFVLGPFASC